MNKFDLMAVPIGPPSLKEKSVPNGRHAGDAKSIMNIAEKAS